MSFGEKNKLQKRANQVETFPINCTTSTRPKYRVRFAGNCQPNVSPTGCDACCGGEPFATINSVHSADQSVKFPSLHFQRPGRVNHGTVRQRWSGADHSSPSATKSGPVYNWFYYIYCYLTDGPTGGTTHLTGTAGLGACESRFHYDRNCN